MLCEKCRCEIKPVDKLLAAVEQVTGVTVAELLGRDLHKHLATARKVAYMLMQRELRWSTTSIAAHFQRDHASISVACKKMRKAVELEEHPSELIKEARNIFYRDHLRAPMLNGEPLVIQVLPATTASRIA